MTLIILMYALFGGSFTMGKVLLRYTTPFFLTGARMFLGGGILLSYLYFLQHEHFQLKRKHLKYFLQIIVLGIFLTYSLRFWALEYLSSSKTCFFYNFSPFLSSLYSYLLFKERMTKKQWLGLIIGFVGLFPILISTSPEEMAMGEWFYLSWPEIAVLVSVALHSYSWIVVRKLVHFKNYSPLMINGVTMFAGGILAFIVSLFIEGTSSPVTEIGPFLGWLAGVILISNIICYNIYGFLLRKYSATFLSFAGFMGPLFAALYGWGFLGEAITWHFYVSAIIVFIGLYIFYQDELRLRTIEQED